MSDVIELEGPDPAPRCDCGELLEWRECGCASLGIDGWDCDPGCLVCDGQGGWFWCRECDP